MEIVQKFIKWCQTLNSKANSNIFGEFWECTSGIGYLIPSKVPSLNAQSWALLVEITGMVCGALRRYAQEEGYPVT